MVITLIISAADLSEEKQWDKVVDASLGFHQRIDILCNTAGVNLRQHADDVTSESWDLTLT